MVEGGMGQRAAKGVASRFAEYIEHLSEVIGHADRHAPPASYCTGLLLPGTRKSVEPGSVQSFSHIRYWLSGCRPGLRQ
jgi:SRSO17 transposase